MAGPYYVRSGAAGAATGADWANAFTTLGAGVTAANADNDIIYVAHDHAETPGVDTTYTFTAGVRVYCANTAAEPPTTLATSATVDGSGTSGLDIIFAGGPFYIYGIIFTCGGSTGAAAITLCNTDDDLGTFEQCGFVIPNSSTGSSITVGSATNQAKTLVITKGCTFTWGHASQGFVGNVAIWRSYGDDFCGGATIPTILFELWTRDFSFECHGGDFSDINTTIFEPSPDSCMEANLWACKLNASVTVFNPTADPVGDVFLRDCASGDTHYNFAHYNYSGNTVAGTAVVTTTAIKAAYDGTNGVSWLVAGTNATPANPYYTPWIDVYNATTTSITPRLEALRSGNTAFFTLAQTWGEFMVKTSVSSTIATMYSQRSRIGTAANVGTSTFTAADWAGENATANAFITYGPGTAVVPTEIGHIRGRIGIAGTFTFYIEPYIRTS